MRTKDTVETKDASGSVFNRGFSSLLATSFLGAANDNVVKTVITNMVATGIWVGTISKSGAGEQAIPAVCLTIPFILLSGFAGQLADRYSKRSIMLWVKVAELPLAIIAFIGFATYNVMVALVALVMLGIQSTFFGPAKFGAIPELVKENQLSPANGSINMFSNLGIMFGIIVSAPLSQWYARELDDGTFAQGLGWAPGLVILLIAIAGLISVWFMPKLKANEPELQIRWNPFSTYIESIRDMGTGPLFVAVCAWSGFYLIGSMELLIIPVYKDTLDINYYQLTALLLVLSVAVGVGSAVAGFVSGKTIRPTMIPLGGLGMTLGFALMGLLPPTFIGMCVLLLFSGFSAGFYIVPLQALIQYLSPDDERGRFLGTANAMSFVFVTIGAVLFFLATNTFGMEEYRVNIICAALALVGMLIGVWQMKRVMSGHSGIVKPGQDEQGDEQSDEQDDDGAEPEA